jgi:hypothetical protein
MAILCGSYKIETAALSKSNLVGMILAHGDFEQSRMMRRLRTDQRVFDGTEALPLRE